jgi:hypothetical protein
MTHRKSPAGETALQAFMATCTEIDDLLGRLHALRDDHFGADPDAVHWGDVGSAGHVADKLRQALEPFNHQQ